MNTCPCRCRRQVASPGRLGGQQFWSRQGTATAGRGRAHRTRFNCTALSTRAPTQPSFRCGRFATSAPRSTTGRGDPCTAWPGSFMHTARGSAWRSSTGADGSTWARWTFPCPTRSGRAIRPSPGRLYWDSAAFLTGLTCASATRGRRSGGQGRQTAMTGRAAGAGARRGRAARGPRIFPNPNFETFAARRPACGSGRRGKVCAANDAGELGCQRQVQRDRQGGHGQAQPHAVPGLCGIVAPYCKVRGQPAEYGKEHGQDKPPAAARAAPVLRPSVAAHRIARARAR